MNIKELAEKYEKYIISMRRDFHENPELSWQEYRTTDVLERELKNIGIKTERLEGTGIIGIIEGSKPGKTVALRADIDGLPIEEQTSLSFKAKNQCMHACGHDCHTSMLLGAAKILWELRSEIKGRVKLIFQPAEETGIGARKVINPGHLKDVDGIFGMHIWGELETNKINFEKGPRMASSDNFKLTIEGKASHGAAPHNGVDAIVVAASVILNIQSIASRNVNPIDPVVITLGTIQGGDRYNIIPQHVVIEGTTRTFSVELRNSLEDRIRKIAETTAEAFGAKAYLEYEYCPCPLINHERLTNLAVESVKKLYGQEALISMDKIMAAEDFALYQQEVPGVFGFLGCGNEKLGKYPNHSDKFMVDESVLKKGAAVYSQFAIDFLNS